MTKKGSKPFGGIAKGFTSKRTTVICVQVERVHNSLRGDGTCVELVLGHRSDSTYRSPDTHFTNTIDDLMTGEEQPTSEQHCWGYKLIIAETRKTILGKSQKMFLSRFLFSLIWCPPRKRPDSAPRFGVRGVHVDHGNIPFR